MADTRTIHLALSPNAAEALEDFMAAHAADANELVVKVGDELTSQLTGLALSPTPVAPRKPRAQVVAERMAEAAAKTLQPPKEG